MTRAIILVTVFFLLSDCAVCQPYTIENGNTRHRFAQSVFGLDMAALPSGVVGGLENSAKLNASSLYPRIHFGGIHFWGHAEFYFNIPLPAFRASQIGDYRLTSTQMDIFGTKIYPWRILKRQLRVYVGFSPSLIKTQLRQKSHKGAFQYSRVSPTYSAGFTLYNKGWMMDAGVSFNGGTQRSVYFTRTKKSYWKFSPYCISVGIRKVFETTAAMEKDYQNGLTEKKYKALAERRKLNSWFVGLGISSTFFTRKSTYLKTERAYLGNRISGFPFPEFVAGYHIPKLKTHFLGVLRMNGYGLNAYGNEIQLKRYVAGIEAHVQLFDFHGFVPFAGINVGYDLLRFTERDYNIIIHSLQKYQGSMAIVFGWDIIPDKIQPFVLRTNLRYTGGLNLKMANGNSIYFDQLEFNFIELVYYPSRWKNIKRIQKD